MTEKDHDGGSSNGNLIAEQPVDLKGGNAQTPNGAQMTTFNQSAPKPKRTMMALVVVAGVVVVLVIAAILLIGVGDNKSTAGEIRNGGYLAYSAVGTGPTGQSLNGNLTMTFENVTKTSYSIRDSFTINGVTSNSSENMTLINGDWVASSPDGSANLTSPVMVGHETLQTHFGQKSTDHYSETYPGYTYEFWQDNGSNMIYQLRFTYSFGMTLTCDLTATNML